MSKWTGTRISARRWGLSTCRTAGKRRPYTATAARHGVPNLMRQLRDMRERDEKEGTFGLDPEAKEVITTAGRLPMSPVMDKTWMDRVAKREEPKPAPTKPPVHRFQKLLNTNMYARALSTPIRMCQITNTIHPKEFLQAFAPALHPETNTPWWAPADLVPSQSSSSPAAEEAGQAAGRAVPNPKTGGVIKARSKPRVIYTLASQAVVGDRQDKGARISLASKLSSRGGAKMEQTVNGQAPIWREGMEVAVLDLYRRRVVDGLLHLARRTEEQGLKHVTPLVNFDDLQGVKTRGCVLRRRTQWPLRDASAYNSLPPEAAQLDLEEGESAGAKEHPSPTTPEYATYDVPNAQFFSKVVVYDLDVLLGKEHLVRLADESAIFRDNAVLLLQPPTHQLYLLLNLWKLQGYFHGASQEALERPKRLHWPRPFRRPSSDDNDRPGHCAP